MFVDDVALLEPPYAVPVEVDNVFEEDTPFTVYAEVFVID